MQWRIGLIVAALAIGACEGSGGGGPTAPPEIPERAPRVVVTPSSASTQVGDTVQFVATAFDRDGNVLGSTVIWQSTNTSISEISQSGLARAKGVGRSVIQASMAGVIGSAQLIVTDAEGRVKASRTGN